MTYSEVLAIVDTLYKISKCISVGNAIPKDFTELSKDKAEKIQKILLKAQEDILEARKEF